MQKEEAFCQRLCSNTLTAVVISQNLMKRVECKKYLNEQKRYGAYHCE